MKKILSVIFVIAMVFSLASCGLPTTPMGSTQSASNMKNATIEETVLYSENDVKIIAKSLDKNNLKVYIENNSNLNLSFNAHSYAVNGIMTKESIYSMRCEVSSGAKATTVLEIPNSFLREYNIEAIEQIDILFWAYDNDKSFKEFETDVIKIKTSLFNNNLAQVTGSEIYNKNGIKIDHLSNDGNSFVFCLTNSTGDYFDFSLTNININGFTASDADINFLELYDEQVLNDCQIKFNIKPTKDFLNINGIENISDINFNIEVSPLNNLFDKWTTDKIEYSVK